MPVNEWQLINWVKKLILKIEFSNGKTSIESSKKTGVKPSLERQRLVHEVRIACQS